MTLARMTASDASSAFTTSAGTAESVSMSVYAKSPRLLLAMASMLTLALPRMLVNCPIMFASFLWQIATRPALFGRPKEQAG